MRVYIEGLTPLSRTRGAVLIKPRVSSGKGCTCKTGDENDRDEDESPTDALGASPRRLWSPGLDKV